MCRREFRTGILVVVGFLCHAAGYVLPCAAGTLEIGSAAPDFRLPGVDGKQYSLESFRSADILVVVFTCNHCPTAQAYEDRIKQLATDYKDKKVAVVAISPNDPQAVRLDELGYTDVGDALEDMKIRARTMPSISPISTTVRTRRFPARMAPSPRRTSLSSIGAEAAIRRPD